MKIEKFIQEIKKIGFIDISHTTLKKLRDISHLGFGMMIDSPIFSGSIQDCSFLHFSPKILFRPISRNQIQSITKLSSKYDIPITFACGKTGLSGGFANSYVVIDLENLHTLKTPIFIDKIQNILQVDQKVLVSDLIKIIPLETNQENIFPVQPSSSFKLPVRIGGLIATNASGVTSGKLGAIDDWIESIEILNPKGEFFNVSKNDPLFRKIIGGNGRYGLILNAKIKLAQNPKNLKYKLLYGNDLEGVFNGLQIIQDKQIFPLTSEFILSNLSLPGLFGKLFSENPVKWAILLKGEGDLLEKFEKIIVESTITLIKNLNLQEFKLYLEERASMALQTISNGTNSTYILYPGFEDVLISPNIVIKAFKEINKMLSEKGFNPIMLGYGHINFRKGQGILMHLRIPVPIEELINNQIETFKKISSANSQLIVLLKDSLNVISKAEHSPGILFPWVDHNNIPKWKKDISEGKAFTNPHLILYLKICAELGISIDKPISLENSQKILEKMFFIYYCGKYL